MLHTYQILLLFEADQIGTTKKKKNPHFTAAVVISKVHTYTDCIFFQPDCIIKGSYLVKIDHATENDWLEKVMVGEFIGYSFELLI